MEGVGLVEIKSESGCVDVLVKDEVGRQPLQDLVPVIKAENLKVEIKDEIDICEEAIEHNTSSQSAAVCDAHSSNNQEFSYSVVDTRSGKESPGTKVECYNEENDRVKIESIPSDSDMVENYLSPRVLVCKLCNVVSTDCKCREHCEALYLSSKLEDNTGELSESPSPQCSDEYVCDHCGISYVVKSDLIQHISMHGEKQTLSGDMSGISLCHNSYLISHKTHSLVHTFSCELCCKSFSQKSVLTIHRRTHLGERLFSCDLCGKSFSRKRYLLGHIRTHSGERLFSCDLCSKSFSHKSNLIALSKTHSGECPFSCYLCGKSFCQKNVLTSHRRTHSGEHPYTCELCSKSFNRKSDLIGHRRTPSGECPFSCDLCE